ncbi:YafY family transcriptional regulator [Paenibacillus psychroresistens]|uniref:YafY family transcriptional regulator n=1 Tax=Paenibacillus psychroresistens TaxID=1778678 RepID=A0A6B8RUU4_9BACL|nr:YafY family protein [Paenibacillus psychroresistens]QGQ98908.1 YafY family transcriptional regulator [Paenibacillus psychroresistens]
MSKADNMLSILWQLKAGKRLTAKQLAESLEMNIRTVYRYIDALCASGVPIVADSGHNGGYSLLQSFREAPLFFDLEEQKALVQAAIFAQEAGYPYGDGLRRAINKLKTYTNEAQLKEINRHSVGFEVIQPRVNPGMQSILQELEIAVADGLTLNMEYHSGKELTSQSRLIDPYGLVNWKGKWYIVGYCHLRSEIRSFRVDRILALERTNAVFLRPEAFSARIFLLKDLLPSEQNAEDLVTIHIKGRPEALNDLCEHWLFGHALVERTHEDAYFQVEKQVLLGYVPHFLLVYGRAIAVIEPTELKDKLIEISSGLLEHYRGL